MSRFARGFSVIVVVAAGVSGVVLLVAPADTDEYFSWTLRPPAAAALIGGLYIGSAVVFGWALRLPLQQARPLFVGVLGLALPTLVLTAVFDDVFDFSRWQAIGWVVLFVGAPVSAVAILATERWPAASSPRLHTWARGLVGVLALGFAALAVLVWLEGTRDEIVDVAPFDLVRLTGTYLGAWCSFLAVLSGWAAGRGTWDDARVALATLTLVGGGATVAFLRSYDDLERPGAALGAAIALTAVGATTYARERPRLALSSSPS